MATDAVPEPLTPPGYAEALSALKLEVRAAQLRAQRVVNTELIALYWRIGRIIRDRQAAEGWGGRVIARLSADLRGEFPEMTGLSPRNLQYMRTLVEGWPDAAEFAQQPAARLPWAHVMVLLDRLDDQGLREWYAAQALLGGWSRAVLLDRIKGRLHERVGRAPSNFSDQLPPADSDLAKELTRDPYRFEFLGLTGRIAERDLEDGLVGQLERFLRELGQGFAFVGRQYRIEIEGRGVLHRPVVL